MQEFAKKFYKGSKWLKCRSAYIAERRKVDGGMCEICHNAPGYIVHHKVTLTAYNIDDPEISLNHSQLMFVCHACHDALEGHGIGNHSLPPLCTFDEYGQPISLRPIDSSDKPPQECY